MAVVNALSSDVSALDAIPPELVGRGLSYGSIQYRYSSVVVTNGDSIGSTYRFFRCHSDWVYLGSEVTYRAIGDTGALLELGMYRIASEGGAVADANSVFEGENIEARGSSGWIVHPLVLAGGTRPIVASLAASSVQPRWYDMVATLSGAAMDADGSVACLAFFGILN
ncbi:MAG: hypothetical protein V3V08_23355 [Nannocystaceae bacterium]